METQAAQELYAEEVRRVCDVLDRLLNNSNLSRREIERRMGLPPSSLSKVLTGVLRLNYAHVMVVLDALGIDRGKFFSYLYPVEQEAPEPLLEGLKLVLAGDTKLPEPKSSRLRQELEGLIQAAVENYFTRRSGPDTTPPDEES